MSKLKINRTELLSDLVPYALMKSNEKAVIEESEKYVKEHGLEDVFIFDSKTFIGVEVEVEGIEGSIPSLAPFWTTKEDGSLRNHGIEFVSTPVRGKGLIVALHGLQRLLSDSFPEHDFSDRTSIHVHVNVRDMTYEAMFSFLMIYIIFESALYKTIFDACGRARDTNIFCVPIQETGKSIFPDQVISEFEGGSNASSLAYLVDGWRKYSGVNLVPIGSFGTIEFRHMGGVNDYRKILEWVNMLLSMKEYASTRSYEFIKSHIMELNTNSMYEVFTRDVFSRLSDNILKYNVKDELERGVVFAKYLFTPRPSRVKDASKEFENSSMRKFLEVKLDRKLEQPKKEQKKSPSSMTNPEIEKALLDVGQEIVRLGVERNMIRNEASRVDGNELDMLRTKYDLADLALDHAVAWKDSLEREYIVRQKNLLKV